jgi:hypothetical protein
MESQVSKSMTGRSLNALWLALRLPIFAMLLTLAPVVRLSLRTLAMLGVLMAFFFRFLALPHFPFWGMLAASVGCTVLLIVYERLLWALSE